MARKNMRGRLIKSVSPRLWEEALYRGMLNGLKLKWQSFSQRSGARSKAWTWFLEQHPPGSGFVCGSGGENKELDCLRPKRRRRRGGRESVSCALKEDEVCFHPLLSTCCSQKTFHPLSWPEAAFPLRPDRLCDLLQVLECLKLISRTHWEIPAAKKTERQPLSVVWKCCLVLHLSHMDLEHSCWGCVVFFLTSPTEWWMIYCCCRLPVVVFGESGLKIITRITWNYFWYLNARGIKRGWWYAPANVLLLVLSAWHFISKWIILFCFTVYSLFCF